MATVTAGYTLPANTKLTRANFNLATVPGVSIDANEVTNASVEGAGLHRDSQVFVDATLGSDGSGVRESTSLPFQTIAAAITASASGDTIIIYPGTYTEDLTAKAGVDIHLIAGVIIVGSITVDTAAAVILSGFGHIDNTGGNALIISNASADVNCYLPLLESNDDSAVDMSAGTLALYNVRCVTKGTNQPAIVKDGGTLTLYSGSLTATGTGDGITAATAQTVTFVGVVETNKTLNANITQNTTGGLVLDQEANAAFWEVNSLKFRTDVQVFSGSGSPEGGTTAAVGSIYLRSNGAGGSSFYVKETGAGNTGWAAYGQNGGADVTTFANSDATPDVSGAYYCETGTAADTITDFDGADIYTSQEIVVVSKAAITYDVTGAGLVGGSTDIVTASGEATRWLYDGTNWILQGASIAAVNYNT